VLDSENVAVRVHAQLRHWGEAHKGGATAGPCVDPEGVGTPAQPREGDGSGSRVFELVGTHASDVCA
jgi:hypothetical protein